MGVAGEDLANGSTTSTTSAPATTSAPKPGDMVKSDSDQRTANNTMRHQYRVLTDEEKAKMLEFKDKGQEFLDLIASCPPSREMSIAKTKTEEAVMWAVKSITA